MPDLMLQRQCTGCSDTSAASTNNEEEPRIKRQAISNSGVGEVAADFASNLGTGVPLDTASRRYFEPRFGHDFGNVRIHNGPQADTAAARVQARAFTLGHEVVFAAGEHDLGSDGGRRLLAHELTHVVQQSGAEGIQIGEKGGPSPTYPIHQPAPAPLIQREERIKKEEVRLFDPKTQISPGEVAIMVEKTMTVSTPYDLVTSSGSSDAAFVKCIEKIALFVVNAFKEANYRTVLALDFSAVDWGKAGVKDAATKKKFGSGLHAFELIRWDGGKKLQLRMNYLREITEITAAGSAAKIKAGKKKFATGSFSFKAPTATEKKLGYKDWAASEKDIVYMAVSRVPDGMLSHAHVKGIEFYRLPKTGKFSAQYDQTKHRMEVGDSTFEVTEDKTTTTLSSPADLYKQSSAISGDAVSGFTSLTEYTIIHEISHALDWGPIRPEIKDLISTSERANAVLAEMSRITEEYKKAKDDAEKKRLEELFKKAKAEQEAAEKDLAKVMKTFAGKTTLSGATFGETSPGNVEEVNPAAQTDFEKAITGKTASTPYAASATGEAFAEGLAQYIVNPGLLKEYRPDLYAYFKKLLPP